MYTCMACMHAMMDLNMKSLGPRQSLEVGGDAASFHQSPEKNQFRKMSNLRGTWLFQKPVTSSARQHHQEDHCTNSNP